MSEEVIKILDELGKRFGVVIDWSNENVLPYLQELIKRFVNYKIGVSIFELVAWSIALILCISGIIICAKFLIKENKKDYYEQSEIITAISIVVIAVSTTILLIAILSISDSVINIIKAKTVPELIVYDYIKTIN